ncbi:hypothetical protein [uncultured Dokdonia sp.]|uniref:hypothetical protein n=1 Tax=uncultured Dokdonia sp. TaxID=575653 RepID=UPI002618B3A8|nr:hypothetical protein [uncultured Dokdonia sp.]
MYVTHHIPEIIKEEAWKALSFYPQLGEVPIHIEFIENSNKPLIQVSPYWMSLLPWVRKKSYTMALNESFTISGATYFTTEIPREIIIGLVGHTLGIVIYLESLSKKDLLQHCLYYFFSKKYRKEVTQIADVYASKQGLNEYVLKTKHFILEKARLSPPQKLRLKSQYSSPQEIIQMINNVSYERDTFIPSS